VIASKWSGTERIIKIPRGGEPYIDLDHSTTCAKLRIQGSDFVKQLFTYFGPTPGAKAVVAKKALAGGVRRRIGKKTETKALCDHAFNSSPPEKRLPTGGCASPMAEQKDEETDDLTTYFEEMDSKNGAKSSSSSGASKVVPAPSGTKTAKVENSGKVVAESHKAARPIPHLKSKFVTPIWQNRPGIFFA
jgi:hypothetical protein